MRKITCKEKSWLWSKYKIPCDNKYLYIFCLSEYSACPTIDEIKVLLAYREFVVSDFYGLTMEEFWEKYPEGAIGGHNTVEFVKGNYLFDMRGENGWGYCRMTWQIGPMYVPGMDHFPEGPWSLMEVINSCRSMCDEVDKDWEKWKKEHKIIPPSSIQHRLNVIKRDSFRKRKYKLKSKTPERIKVLLAG